jgi:cob(I)alamin adenosyltransferase
MLKQGLIQIYNSNSPRSNFAPIGLGLRAAGQNLRARITCFSPHELLEGAAIAQMYLQPRLIFDLAAAADDASADLMGRAFAESTKKVKKGDFDLLVFSGIHRALQQGAIHCEDLLALIDGKPAHVELVFSGMDLPEPLLDKADLLTEMAVSQSSANQPGNPKEGCVEVITGDGKGKTTYCLGKALLMSSMGIRSAFLQFIKSPSPYGEVKAIKKLPHLDIVTMGVGFLFTNSGEARKKHLEAARHAWEECLREIFSLKYGLVVLDEINTATYYGLVNPERVREMLFLKPKDLDILLSGRNAHTEVRVAASAILEMREIRHPFNKGVQARKGIEF